MLEVREIPTEIWTFIFKMLYEPYGIDLLTIRLVCKYFNCVVAGNCKNQYTTQRSKQGCFKDMPCNLDLIKSYKIISVDYIPYNIIGSQIRGRPDYKIICKDYSELKMVVHEESKIPSIYFDQKYFISYEYKYGFHYLIYNDVSCNETTPKRRMIITNLEVEYGTDLYVQDCISKDKYPMAWSKKHPMTKRKIPDGHWWYTFIKANVEKIRLIRCKHNLGPFKFAMRSSWVNIDTTQDVVTVYF